MDPFWGHGLNNLESIPFEEACNIPHCISAVNEKMLKHLSIYFYVGLQTSLWSSILGRVTVFTVWNLIYTNFGVNIVISGAVVLDVKNQKDTHHIFIVL